ncbi:MAG: hypothetical protein COA78_10425 [Blastopirellula sp.]|nr:MAG: hypothetical protein COA78_10425 [Blastopirellula sp.]
MVNKLTQKPKELPVTNNEGRFERFNLIENPFPSEPIVNRDSSDRRINGGIFEGALRKAEYDQVIENYVKQPHRNPTHLRLGYLMDASYIGRGNGKSAFLLHVQDAINREYGLDLSDGLNKCFAIYVPPEPGGRTKSFPLFIDCIFDSLVKSNIIRDCIAILRLKSIEHLYPDSTAVEQISDTDDLLTCLENRDWYQDNSLDYIKIATDISENEFLQELPPEFPLFKESSGRYLFTDLVQTNDFTEYYQILKKGSDQINFVFSHLVRFFQAADFTGCQVLVDDFERIPDFQSGRQKRDFATELRTILYDGMSVNARIGFFNFLLVLHAGVQRLIADAWQESGLEMRSPISGNSSHVVKFEKLNRDHASLLLKTYLNEYRSTKNHAIGIEPFTEDAVSKISEGAEYNAAKILKAAYSLLEKAANDISVSVIDEDFVIKHHNSDSIQSAKDEGLSIEKADTTDLIKKARGEIN